ncbi:hypothetical protein ADK88_08445 [Streptomyces sp. NRRL F-2295]|nr:hypothetical protein ADK88_08445 [Streptomyces sp. NRRL F-2295]
MHRAVLEQSQDRRPHVTAPRPPPATAAPPASATEGPAAERRPERPERGPTAVALAPPERSGAEAPVPLLMSVSM